MAQSPDQQNYYFRTEAVRTGIHKPILAALYKAHNQPALKDGETGLGISPANRIRLEQLNTLSEQIQYAANTLRSLSEHLLQTGWTASDLWLAEKGQYTDKFIKTVAAGYAPEPNDTKAARLESCDEKILWQAYLNDFKNECQIENYPDSLAYLDSALLTWVDSISRYYIGIPNQRNALLEIVRIWSKLDSRADAVAKLPEVTASLNLPKEDIKEATLDESHLDRPLLHFASKVRNNFIAYPHQREALLRGVQLWRQLNSRQEAIISLKTDTSAEAELKTLDPALIAFVGRIRQFYSGQTQQRNAITEAVRIWRQLDSRKDALLSLGINPEILESGKSDRIALMAAAAQLDRELLDFVRRVAISYSEEEHQREALINLVKIWRQLPGKEQAISSLFEDLKQMNVARRGVAEGPPVPMVILPKKPERWTPETLQMHAPIIPEGSFTWAAATAGGTQMPTDQGTIDAIMRIAKQAQFARDRIGRSFQIINWYRSDEYHRPAVGENYNRHRLGDAIEFYCDGLTGNQIYWFLDPWWSGGLGRYRNYPYLIYIDARNYRARWLH
jgi:hypothetical protein